MVARSATRDLRRLRSLVGVAVAVFLLALAGAVPAQPAANDKRASLAAANSIEASLLSAINHMRQARGLQPLSLSHQLARAADVHARSMAQLGFFSHTSADGTSASARVRRFYRGSAFGETLLWRSPNLTPQQALQMWLHSAPHRAILTSAAFSEIGLGAVRVANASGTYRGLNVTIVVADFGSR